MTDWKPVSTTMENRLTLQKGDEKQRTSKPYRELVGCLLYASITTRPDLAAAVNFFSQFQSCPNEEHWIHLKRILRYIKGTLDIGLVFKVEENVPLLQVFCDADWANDPNDCRSVSGCVVKLYGSTIGWFTRKQQTVSLSSAEAELAALCTAAAHDHIVDV
ncbi:uncharacterized protein LOC134206040 [Armigeres subalbatus]|uniref:uncharacterized protein LOC134206040 n=1 Tax=Armigeres subalbatus TaxID=124917 RepID=UPI002ED1D7B6